MLIGNPGFHSDHLWMWQALHHGVMWVETVERTCLYVSLLSSSSFCLCFFNASLLSSWGRIATADRDSVSLLPMILIQNRTATLSSTSAISQHHLLVIHQPAETGKFHTLSRRGGHCDVPAVPVITHQELFLLEFHHDDLSQVVFDVNYIGVRLQFS